MEVVRARRHGVLSRRRFDRRARGRNGALAEAVRLERRHGGRTGSHRSQRHRLRAGRLPLGLAGGPGPGAEVPTSLALVGELAPAKSRGKLLGFTQVAWCLGPTVVLWLALALARLELLGIRIVFLHLCVVAMVTWAMRRGLSESARWVAAAANARQGGA